VLARCNKESKGNIYKKRKTKEMIVGEDSLESCSHAHIDYNSDRKKKNRTAAKNRYKSDPKSVKKRVANEVTEHPPNAKQT
jgi:hypothetical protein